MQSFMRITQHRGRRCSAADF